jgi:hypothetical protein
MANLGERLSRRQLRETEGEDGSLFSGPGRASRKRWPHSFGQSSEIFKWNVRGSHAANLIAGSVAKYASSGVRSSRLE